MTMRVHQEALDILNGKIAAAVAAERERCARIADARSKLDRDRYQTESDWRLPYAYYRVIRASIDIAAEIRRADGESERS